jgi:uncharacterized protein YjbJ (UPF0337 family)
MARSARRDKATGTVDKVAGRILEVFGKMTGRASPRVKGKAARGRGKMRTTRGRTKDRAKRGRGRR